MTGNSRHSGYERAAHEFYVEPPRATEALLDVETFGSPILDPCCGSGTIPKVCIGRGYSALASDIVDRGYLTSEPWDFLQDADQFSVPVGGIICNVPFSLGVAVTLRALSMAPKVAILQRTTWLEGEGRYQKLFRVGFLARVWQFRSRISMPPGGTDVPAKGGSVAYSWFVFESRHSGAPQLGWLP